MILFRVIKFKKTSGVEHPNPTQLLCAPDLFEYSSIKVRVFVNIVRLITWVVGCGIVFIPLGTVIASEFLVLNRLHSFVYITLFTICQHIQRSFGFTSRTTIITSSAKTNSLFEIVIPFITAALVLNYDGLTAFDKSPSRTDVNDESQKIYSRSNIFQKADGFGLRKARQKI